MFDSKKIDNYFAYPQTNALKKASKLPLRQRIIHTARITLPVAAAFLIGLLIIILQVKKNFNDLTSELITPYKGELEKFHMEKGIFYITDAKNIVNNFNADTLDETAPGSKLIKMINPSGILPTEQREEVYIKAPIGFYNQETKLLKLQDGVNLEYSAGILTQTQEMFFDFNQNKAYGDKPISTTSETADITAKGFEYYKDKNLLIYTGKNHITIKNMSIKEAQ